MAFGSISNTGFGGTGYQPKLFDFGAALIATTQAGARPAFELQFYNTQNAQLDKLQKEIDEIYAKKDTTSATALLSAKVKQLEQSLTQIDDFKTRTDARIAKTTITISSLNDLRALADPSTVNEFNAKLAETIDTIQKIEARPYEFYGVNDKVRQYKFDALARLQSLTTNDFATQQDIDNVTAELDSIRNNFQSSQQIANANANLAFTKSSSTSSRLYEIKGRISSISIDANAETLSKVQERKDYYAQILSTLSLAFEASQNLTDFVNKSLLPQKADPGSVVNLFS